MLPASDRRNPCPRGTKTLTRAFFSATDGIPESERGPVIKATLVAVRDQLKEDWEKVKAAKAKATVKPTKTPSAVRRKPAAAAPKKQRVIAAKGKSARAGNHFFP
jgi:hypothetical protein